MEDNDDTDMGNESAYSTDCDDSNKASTATCKSKTVKKKDMESARGGKHEHCHGGYEGGGDCHHKKRVNKDCKHCRKMRRTTK